MKRYNNNIRLIFFTIAAFLCSSCRMNEKGLDYHNDSHFLFIPVDSEQTYLWLLLYLFLILCLFIYMRFTQAQVGWHQHEVKNNIYDNDGHKIGSVGTGEHYETYYSQESADKVRNICIMIQLAATIALANGIICSWIFAGGSVTFYISVIVLTIVGFIKTIRNEKLKETILSLQLWIGIICTILCIIYAIISGS
ncbi:MAG: hypothetical protein E7124_09095 [Bacteroidales bacterium]|nr:hypothetical protein [Bacteroidales bacterium]